MGPRCTWLFLLYLICVIDSIKDFSRCGYWSILLSICCVYIYVSGVVASKILDSSELVSCLLEMGVEYYLVCTWYQRRTAAVWEGRGATARPREAKWSSGVAAVFT